MSNPGQFSKDNQPKGRGKSEKTKFIDALKRKARTEDQFYELCIERAFDPDDNFAFKEILARLSPLSKAVAPTIEFDFPAGAKPHVQAQAIIKGIADGVIPPDLGAQLITSILSMLKIQEVTDIDERLKIMESQLDEDK